MREDVGNRRTALILIGIGLYLNIGWAIANYYHSHILCDDNRSTSILKKIMRGPEIIAPVQKDCSECEKFLNRGPVYIAIITLSAPFLAIGIPTAWLAAGIYYTPTYLATVVENLKKRGLRPLFFTLSHELSTTTRRVASSLRIPLSLYSPQFYHLSL